MSEKSGKDKKAGMRSAGGGRAKTSKPERKKGSRRLFSLDSLMGKGLCVLLVVILVVVAFLAPKLINNLYDAGTLMQITYMDMDINPYAVPYTVFQDKLMAIARARSEGMQLIALPAEGTADEISDEELIGIVNEEMKKAEHSMDMLFVEGWWDAQTVSNLISKEKYTVYMRAPVGEEVSQEMTPFQVWTLTFEMTGKQDEVIVYDGKEEVLSQFATHRLIVCMDADFYKVVAFAVRGSREKTEKLYGEDMIFAFGAGVDASEEVRRVADIYRDNEYMYETQVYLADGIRQGWADYWDIALKKYLYQIDNEGTLGAYLIFEDEAAGAQEENSGEEEAFGMADNSGATAAAGTQAVSVAGRYTDLVVADDALTEVYDADIDAEARERETKALREEGYPEEVAAVTEEGELFLEATGRVEWEEMDDNIWMLKTGCADFFEMMQF